MQAAEGVEIHLICATRGERGWMGDEKDHPGLSKLGALRERELTCAAQTLGIKRVQFLDYLDGILDRLMRELKQGTFEALPARRVYIPKELVKRTKFRPLGIPAVCVRVAQEVPDTLLLAEAFWLMEGYFVRSLGMHRVYNSAFMNMLRDEKNQEYRLVIKNTLEFDPEILKRYVNFMNNPDERTAVDQIWQRG